jgi:hypothetical protein
MIRLVSARATIAATADPNDLLAQDLLRRIDAAIKGQLSDPGDSEPSEVANVR